MIVALVHRSPRCTSSLSNTTGRKLTQSEHHVPKVIPPEIKHALEMKRKKDSKIDFIKLGLRSSSQRKKAQNETDETNDAPQSQVGSPAIKNPKLKAMIRRATFSSKPMKEQNELLEIGKPETDKSRRKLPWPFVFHNGDSTSI